MQQKLEYEHKSPIKIQIEKLPDMEKQMKKINGKIYGQTAAYLNGLEIGWPTQNRGGVSWLELYVDAELNGLRMDRYDEAESKGHRAGKKTSTEMCFRKFVSISKKIIKYGASDEHAQFFKAEKNNKQRLIGLGTLHHQKGICGMPNWEEGLQKDIAQAITQLRCKIDGRAVKAIQNQTFMLAPKKLNMKGTPPWRNVKDDNKKKYESKGEKMVLHTYENKELEAYAEKPRELNCVVCHAKNKHAHKPTERMLKWEKKRCERCERKTELKEWKCECGISLYRCEKHRQRFHEQTHPKVVQWKQFMKMMQNRKKKMRPKKAPKASICATEWPCEENQEMQELRRRNKARMSVIGIATNAERTRAANKKRQAKDMSGDIIEKEETKKKKEADGRQNSDAVATAREKKRLEQEAAATENAVAGDEARARKNSCDQVLFLKRSTLIDQCKHEASKRAKTETGYTVYRQPALFSPSNADYFSNLVYSACKRRKVV